MNQLSLDFARSRIPHHSNYTIDCNGTVYGKRGEPLVGAWVDGYCRVQINGKREYVHRLVLLTFVGPCPDGFQACHKNSDRADNRLCNLTWGSRKKNARDRLRSGGYACRGLSDKDKQRAQVLYEQGFSIQHLRKEFKIDGRTLRRYAKKYNWQRNQTPPHPCRGNRERTRDPYGTCPRAA